MEYIHTQCPVHNLTFTPYINYILTHTHKHTTRTSRRHGKRRPDDLRFSEKRRCIESFFEERGAVITTCYGQPRHCIPVSVWCSVYVWMQV
jgi:hypothetical protein